MAMIPSVFGIAIVALPFSIKTAGYMEELTKGKTHNKERINGG